MKTENKKIYTGCGFEMIDFLNYLNNIVVLYCKQFLFYLFIYYL